ncbi:MAG: F0F1 ATP synthase subunit delta, partial [Arsenophonus sp. NC-LC2-MAG3]
MFFLTKYFVTFFCLDHFSTRPYAKAAFDFAVEKQLVDKWQNMLSFVDEVTRNQQIGEL